MPTWITALLSALWPLLNWVMLVWRKAAELLKYLPFIVKVSVYLFAFYSTSSLIAFFLYHVYYWMLIGSSMFVTPMTFNLMYYSLVWAIVFLIYQYFFK